MASRIYCDMCKKTISIFNDYSLEIKPLNSIKQMFYSNRFDLCEECKQKVENFIENMDRFEEKRDCNNCANSTEPDEVDNGCYMCCKGYENNYKPIK